MKVLITGGGGFIGNAVKEILLKNGHHIKLLDINLREESDRSDVENIQGSILDKYIVSEAVKGCDAVIHLAAMLGVRKTDTLRLQCLNINIEGSVNIMEACVKERVNRIIFSSSSEVYGESNHEFISEDSPIQPKSVYAVTKIAAEEYLKAYAKNYDLDYSIVRFFNVYGCGQVAEFVLPRFVHMVQNNLSPVVYGLGDQIRSFCYMEDAAQGVYKALTNKNGINQVFNIGNNFEPISIKELAKVVIDLSGRKLEPKFVDMHESDRETSREIYARKPDISKAQELLDFHPEFLLADGISKVMASGGSSETWYEPIKLDY